MQNNIKMLKKLKDFLSSEIDTLLIFLKSKFFGLIVFMGSIYRPNILKHRFTDSLHDTPNFQKLWHVIDFIYFRGFYAPVTKQTPAAILMMGKEAAVTKFVFLLTWTCDFPEGQNLCRYSYWFECITIPNRYNTMKEF